MKTAVVKALVLVILVILCGYLRDTLFVRITWYQKVAAGHAYPPEPHALFNFLSHFSLQQLTVAKYVFTGVFTAVFLGICFLMVRWFFYAREHMRLVWIVFLSTTGLAVLLITLGWITGNPSATYAVARYVLGIVETPLVVIFLFPVLLFSQKMQSVKKG